MIRTPASVADRKVAPKCFSIQGAHLAVASGTSAPAKPGTMA